MRRGRINFSKRSVQAIFRAIRPPAIGAGLDRARAAVILAQEAGSLDRANSFLNDVRFRVTPRG